MRTADRFSVWGAARCAPVCATAKLTTWFDQQIPPRIQGIATGIGFVGAGSILKLNEEHHIEGLTTAAGVWMTAAIGVAVGLGSLGVALLSTLFTLIVLALAGPLEDKAETRRRSKAEEMNNRA
jgi:uncharacterized membrane protein YhiD involved in acid resistance